MRGPVQRAWAAARVSTDLQKTVPVLLSLQVCGLCWVRQVLGQLGQAGAGEQVAVRRLASSAWARQAASVAVRQWQQVDEAASSRAAR